MNLLYLVFYFTYFVSLLNIGIVQFYFYISDINWELLFKRERRRANRLVLTVQKLRQDLEAYRFLTRGLKRKLYYYKHK